MLAENYKRGFTEEKALTDSTSNESFILELNWQNADTLASPGYLWQPVDSTGWFKYGKDLYNYFYQVINDSTDQHRIEIIPETMDQRIYQVEKTNKQDQNQQAIMPGNHISCVLAITRIRPSDTSVIAYEQQPQGFWALISCP